MLTINNLFELNLLKKKNRVEEPNNKNFTFSPQINNISKEIMKVKNQDSVYKRLYFGVFAYFLHEI